MSSACDGEGLIDGFDAAIARAGRRPESDFLAVQRDRAGVRDQGTRQGLDEAGFSGAVVADDGQHFAGKQIEIGAADSGDVSIPLDKAPSRQHGIGVWADGGTGCVGCGDHDILRRVSWSKATAAMTRTPVARF
jgi:hypothetical protein